MAAPSRSSVDVKSPSRRRRRAVRLATDQDQASPSPALGRQALLEAQWSQIERLAEPGKWSQRKTLAFVGLTCGGFWGLVILGIARVAH